MSTSIQSHEAQAGPFVVRPCTTMGEFQQMEELQLKVWEFSDRDVVPSQMFVVAEKSGGQVLGAFVGDVMAGFALAFAAVRDERPYLHSHMAAVLPQYRDLGIGRAMKLAQREDALARGITLMEWTFDPLQVKNAYFNICRLGVICRRYMLNVYGATSSPLHGGIPTDRLVAEWYLDSARVEAVLRGEAIGADPGRSRIALRHRKGQVPADWLAAEQASLRAQFQQRFAAGEIVTWFEQDAASAAYVLGEL